jgi:hypothetical protein
VIEAKLQEMVSGKLSITKKKEKKESRETNMMCRTTLQSRTIPPPHPTPLLGGIPESPAQLGTVPHTLRTRDLVARVYFG